MSERTDTFYPTTARGADFLAFTAQVLDHIENYTVPQYGDKGEDQATEFTSHDHVVQAKKYLNRYGKNSRPGQEILDLVKTAHYKRLRTAGWRPEQARSVLPNSLKTEIVMTANLREWRHFFKLRTAMAAHPQMREVARPLLDEFKRLVPVVFDDIKGSEG